MDGGERPVRRSRVRWIAAAVLGAIALLLSSVGVGSPLVARVTVVFAVFAVIGTLWWAERVTAQQRRDHEEALTTWAAERAATAERLRIARELHDLGSHGLGLITVRAAAARTVVGPDAERECSAALADIERAGREATTELRRLLGVLRDPEDRAPLRPTASLSDLSALVTVSRRAGVEVDLDVPANGAVSPGVQAAVHAVVDEALANVARHAGPGARARVTVRRDDREVSVMVEDAGPVREWLPQPGAGRGLDGLRERAALMGGTLEAGPAASGWRVLARFSDGESP